MAVAVSRKSSKEVNREGALAARRRGQTGEPKRAGTKRRSTDRPTDLERRDREVELVGVVLVDEREPRLRRAPHLARARRERALNELDERRLAVAVLAEQHNARLGRHADLGAGEEGRPARVVERDAAALHEEAVEPAARREQQRQLDVLLQPRELVRLGRAARLAGRLGDRGGGRSRRDGIAHDVCLCVRVREKAY